MWLGYKNKRYKVNYVAFPIDLGQAARLLYRVVKKTVLLRFFEQFFAKKNFFLIFAKMTFLGVILCEKSIARTL